MSPDIRFDAGPARLSEVHECRRPTPPARRLGTAASIDLLGLKDRWLSWCASGEVTPSRAFRSIVKRLTSSHDQVAAPARKAKPLRTAPRGEDPDPEPSEHPHVHSIVNVWGEDGKRMNPRKEDRQRWRETCAEALRDNGIVVTATGRLQRIKLERGESRAVRQITEDHEIA